MNSFSLFSFMATWVWKHTSTFSDSEQHVVAQIRTKPEVMQSVWHPWVHCAEACTENSGDHIQQWMYIVVCDYDKFNNNIFITIILILTLSLELIVSSKTSHISISKHFRPIALQIFFSVFSKNNTTYFLTSNYETPV